MSVNFHQIKAIKLYHRLLKYTRPKAVMIVVVYLHMSHIILIRTQLRLSEYVNKGSLYDILKDEVTMPSISLQMKLCFIKGKEYLNFCNQK